MGPRVRGAGGRGKPGRMGAGAGGMLDAGHARSFHKRKSMRKGDGRYGARGWIQGNGGFNRVSLQFLFQKGFIVVSVQRDIWLYCRRCFMSRLIHA